MGSETIRTRVKAGSHDKVRVIHLIHSLDMGGAEQVVANYARYLDKARFIFSACALRSGGRLFNQLRSEGVPTFMIGKQAGADFRTLWRLTRLLRREKVDIIHTHNASAHGWGLLAAVCLDRPILVATEHSIHFPGRGGKAYSLIRRLFRSRFAAVISCCEKVRQTQLAPWGLPSSKHIVIHNGIDISRYDSHLGLPRMTPQLFLDSGRPVIGTVGSLTHHKGQSILIDAVAKLRECGSTPQVLIFGEGPLRDALSDRILRNGLKGQVRLMGISNDVSEVLPCLDIFVLPSLREGFPITILEAMAAGLPVVASDVGGCREAVLDGVTGLLAPPGDADRLAVQLKRLIDDRSERTAMSEAGRRRVITNFQVTRMVNETEKLYDRLLGRTELMRKSHASDSLAATAKIMNH